MFLFINYEDLGKSTIPSTENMTRFQITHVKKDSNGVITHVKVGSTSFSVESIVKWIQNDGEYVYTIKYGKEATVYVRKHWKTNRQFLTTEPDGLVENNLDFLPTFY